MHHDLIPGTATDNGKFILEMKVDTHSAAGFKVDIVVEACLIGE